DFQGGRRGALQYDLASLLYDAKTRLPKALRDELAAYYLRLLQENISIDEQDFKAYYQAYTLCRLMQALGAFGFRGLVEKKEGFAESIPPALAMIREILDEWSLSIELPELKAVFQRMQAVQI
nr:phosphotransferase [Bacteroidales bacterium]